MKMLSTYFKTTMLLAVLLSASACSISAPGTSVDRAYSLGGDEFYSKGAYTRTIFSTSNF